MTFSYLQFQISQMRQSKLILAIDAIGMLVFSLFGAALLPQLVVQFVLSNQAQFTQPPVWFQYIPAFFFALGVGFFVYAVLSMMMLAKKIKKLENELADYVASCNCSGMDCCQSNGAANLAEMMATAEKVVEKAEKKAKTSKSKTKKSPKKKAANK